MLPRPHVLCETSIHRSNNATLQPGPSPLAVCGTLHEFMRLNRLQRLVRVRVRSACHA